MNAARLQNAQRRVAASATANTATLPRRTKSSSPGQHMVFTRISHAYVIVRGGCSPHDSSVACEYAFGFTLERGAGHAVAIEGLSFTRDYDESGATIKLGRRV